MNHRRASALVLLLSGGLAACGGDDGEREEGTRAPATDTQPAGGSETVELDEFRFSPERLTVKAGATITAKNVGAIAHNLTIERGPDASKPSEVLAATSTFAGGENDTVTVDLPPGRYALVCTVGDHREQGMTGTLTVR
jgi:plastocyanin